MRFTLISATSKLNAECHIRRSLSCPLLSRILIMPCINLSFCKVECWTLKVSYVDPTHVQRSIGCFDEQRLWRVSWKSVIEPSSYFSSALDLFWSKLTCFHRLCKGNYEERQVPCLRSIPTCFHCLFEWTYLKKVWGSCLRSRLTCSYILCKWTHRGTEILRSVFVARAHLLPPRLPMQDCDACPNKSADGMAQPFI